MTLGQLYKFCGDRSDILRPWTRGGFTWATDGRALIRCIEPSTEDNLSAPDTRKLFDLYPQPDRWSSLDMPDRNRVTPCATCGHCSEAVSGIVTDGRNSGLFSLYLLGLISDNIPDAEICILDNGGPFLWFRSEGVLGILLGLKKKEEE